MKSLDGKSQDSFIREQIVPILSDVVRDESVSEKGGKIDRALTLAFFGFVASFLIVRLALPDNLIGNTIAFISFPVLFLASLALSACIYRKRLAEIFSKVQERFLIRSRVMHAIAGEYDLDYIPLPGGPALAFKMLANWRFCPQIIKDIYEVLYAHGGFDDVGEIIRASGLAVPSEIVIGSKETKEKHYAQKVDMQQLEDGFKGVSNGIAFAAVGWTENGDETKIHHFIISLKMPKRLTGSVKFKTRNAAWPVSAPNLDFKNVRLVSSDFKRNFEVRASDQMEGRLIFDPAVIARLTDYGEAKMGAQTSDGKIKIRGSMFGDNLVVDFVGDKRFDILDLSSGEWDIARIQRTLDDVTDMLKLVNGVGAVFWGPLRSVTYRPPRENAA